MLNKELVYMLYKHSSIAQQNIKINLSLLKIIHSILNRWTIAAYENMDESYTKYLVKRAGHERIHKVYF